MQKVTQALERLNMAVEKLENASHNDASKAELAQLNEDCAYLRADIVALKKANGRLETSKRRAAQQVEKAVIQIDDVLRGNHD